MISSLIAIVIIIFLDRNERIRLKKAKKSGRTHSPDSAGAWAHMRLLMLFLCQLRSHFSWYPALEYLPQMGVVRIRKCLQSIWRIVEKGNYLFSYS